LNPAKYVLLVPTLVVSVMLPWAIPVPPASTHSSETVVSPVPAGVPPDAVMTYWRQLFAAAPVNALMPLRSIENEQFFAVVPVMVHNAPVPS